MTHTSLRLPQKSPEVARRDRAFGFAAALSLWLAVVAGVVLALRRVRARAIADRADRELRERIDSLHDGGAR